MNYKIKKKRPTHALIYPESVLDDLFAILPNVTNFNFKKGNYYINQNFVIDKDNIVFRSTNGRASDVHIYQKVETQDGLVVRDCSGVILENISVHNKFSNKIPLTMAGVSNTKVRKCYFYGSSDTFSVYYAGPTGITEGVETLDTYNNNMLDENNIFEKNVVYSDWSGDNVAFALQSNGKFSRNIIRGGKVAVYMCRNCNILNNTIYDSSSNGIYISFPSHNILCEKNKICECKASAIKLANQVEHGLFDESLYNIIIRNNTFYDSKTYNIEVNHGVGLNITDNKCISGDIYGMYFFMSHNVNVINNKISYFKVGIWSELSYDLNIKNNSFNCVYPEKCDNILKCVGSNNVSFNDNILRGKIEYDTYAIDDLSTDINTDNNPHHPFYEYKCELRINKFKL